MQLQKIFELPRFVDSLRALDTHHASRNSTCLILDNHYTHAPAKGQTYLNTIPDRFTFVVIPGHASWLRRVGSLWQDYRLIGTC